MQRTVKSIRFTYAQVELDKEGNLVTAKATIEVPETNEKKAYKMAVKKLGHTFQPIKIEVVEDLWLLDDEIFFKYAHKKITEEAGE